MLHSVAAALGMKCVVNAVLTVEPRRAVFHEDWRRAACNRHGVCGVSGEVAPISREKAVSLGRGVFALSESVFFYGGRAVFPSKQRIGARIARANRDFVK